eukprot:scaffold155036_cov23-Tisochrysis_lutea.AAC.4
MCDTKAANRWGLDLVIPQVRCKSRMASFASSYERKPSESASALTKISKISLPDRAHISLYAWECMAARSARSSCCPVKLSRSASAWPVTWSRSPEHTPSSKPTSPAAAEPEPWGDVSRPLRLLGSESAALLRLALSTAGLTANRSACKTSIGSTPW